MPVFIKVGGGFVNAECVAAVEQAREGGPVVLQLTDGTRLDVNTDDGKALLAWAAANLAALTEPPARTRNARVERLELPPKLRGD